MNKDDLREYDKKLSSLSDEEKKMRNIYLRKLATGEIQGPPIGYPNFDKPWLASYTEKQLDINIPKKTGIEYLYERNKNNRGIALNFMGLKISFPQMFERIVKVAKALTALGVKKGDIVTVNCVTLPQTVYLLYALNYIGACGSFTDVRSDKETINFYLNEGKSDFFFCLDSVYPSIEKSIEGTNVKKVILLNPEDEVPIVAKTINNILTKRNNIDEYNEKNKQNEVNERFYSENSNIISWEKFMSGSKKIDKITPPGYEKDTAMAIIHTSGSTSRPKSVVLTNENFNGMAQQYIDSGFIYEKSDNFLNIIPIFTAYGAVSSLHNPLCLGMTDIIYPKVVNDDFPDIIMKYKPNHVTAIPMHWKFLLTNKKMQNFDLSFLKNAVAGGDAISSGDEKKINDFFKKHGCKYKLVTGYGMSELGGGAVTNSTSLTGEKTVGIPLIMNNVKIVDPDSGKELPYGEVGEIMISSPTLMKEYLENKKDTDEAIEVDEFGNRWLHTGDLAHVDESGNIFIDGRLKRVIVRRGFKISASAIEDVVSNFPGIKDCAVVGKKDGENGENPYVLIVSDYNVDESTILRIIESCKEKLPSFSVPSIEDFEQIVEIPYKKNAKKDYESLSNYVNSNFTKKL